MDTQDFLREFMQTHPAVQDEVARVTPRQPYNDPHIKVGPMSAWEHGQGRVPGLEGYSAEPRPMFIPTMKFI